MGRDEGNGVLHEGSGNPATPLSTTAMTTAIRTGTMMAKLTIATMATAAVTTTTTAEFWPRLDPTDGTISKCGEDYVNDDNEVIHQWQWQRSPRSSVRRLRAAM